ncbi:MAG: pepsin/retropepsin-like aspartic protease family protein, partial [Candidatus Limnocylindrales bacterium]
PESTRAPFVRTDPLPIVMVRLNGGAEVPFFLDTGGAEVILDASFARTSGIPLFGSQRTYFGGGKTAGLGHGSADSLTIGDTTVRNLPVNVLDLAPMGPMLKAPGLAGCIGTCLLYRFLATIDYPGEALVLRRKAPLSEPVGGAIDLPLLLADDHFILAGGKLNDGPPATFFVDSGLAGGAFACPASTLKQAGIRRGSGPTVEGHGGGGAMKVWPFDVASLSLGDARQEGLQGIAGAFPPQLEWAFGFRIGGLISHVFLRSYAVTFDFERMAIRLEPASV